LAVTPGHGTKVANRDADEGGTKVEEGHPEEGGSL